MLSLRKFTASLMAALCLFGATGSPSQAQTTGCIIASNDGRNGFRTDEISGCRINVNNGNAGFVMNGETRQRSYAQRQPLTTQHLDIATYWLNRSGQLRFPNTTNPAQFNVQEFLRQASQATHGFVLVRNRNRGPAMNIVYITDGVYRSIDFPGTNLRETPSGFLMTQ